MFNENYEELYKLGAATIHDKNILENYDSFSVETKKLDELIQLNNLGFIKIDVEGHETEVIKGSTELIKKNKPTLLVEIEERHSKKPIDLTINYIKGFGYECFQVKDNEVKKFELNNHSLKNNKFLFLSN